LERLFYLREVRKITFASHPHSVSTFLYMLNTFITFYTIFLFLPCFQRFLMFKFFLNLLHIQLHYKMPVPSFSVYTVPQNNVQLPLLVKKLSNLTTSQVE